MKYEPSSKSVFSRYMGARKLTIRHKDVDGKIYYETRQDCEPIVEFVKQRRDAPNVQDREFTYFGEIPLADLGQMMRDGSLDDEKHIRRYLNERPKLKAFDGTL